MTQSWIDLRAHAGTMGGIVAAIAGGLVRAYAEPSLVMLFFDLVVATAYPSGESEASPPPTRAHALLASRPLRWLARISLGMYVVHHELLFILTLAVYGPHPAPAQPAHLRLMPRWGSGAALLMTVLLGWLVTESFERPLGKILVRFAERASAKRSSTVV